MIDKIYRVIGSNQFLESPRRKYMKFDDRIGIGSISLKML